MEHLATSRDATPVTSFMVDVVGQSEKAAHKEMIDNDDEQTEADFLKSSN